MNKNEGIVSSIIYIALGLMLIIMKGSVISLAITILGVAVLISAIMDLVNKLTNIGIVKAVIGVCILAFGWMFIDLALYILAASIIVMGLLKISNIHKFSPFIAYNASAPETISVISCVMAACLTRLYSIDKSWSIASALFVADCMANILAFSSQAEASTKAP